MALLRSSIFIGLSLILAGCGFSLRGNDIITAKFVALELQLAQPNSELASLLKRNLEIAAVNLNDSGTDLIDPIDPIDPSDPIDPIDPIATSTPVLQMGAEQLVRRPVSVNPRARAAQYELRLSVETSLSLDANLLMGPETLVVERSYFEDIESIVGNQEELEIITAEMRRELINQLLRRLEAVNI